MGRTIIRYSLQYTLFICICALSFLIERNAGLIALTLWLFLYMGYRYTSLTFLFCVTTLYDMFSFHPVGITPLFVGISLFAFEYLHKKRVPRWITWLFCCVGCMAYLLISVPHHALPWLGFIGSSGIYFVLFIYRIRIRDMFSSLHVRT
jgi:hypothetical protein